MGLQIYTLQQAEYWDSIVRSFPNYDIYWLSGYVRAFRIHGDGEPLLFFYEDEELRGINVVMKRDISEDKHFCGKLPPMRYFDFSTPYGYGGWLVEGQNPDMLFKEYERWCKDNGIISEFARFHPVLENHLYSAEHYNIFPLGNTITLDLSSPELIWENLTSKNRNMIRKAQKNGIQIYSGRYPQIYDIFRIIYNETMQRDQAEDYYYFEEDFYTSILNDLPQNAQIFYASYNEKIIAASIMLTANSKMNYHLSGSVKEYSHLAPTNLILYEAALWGCANGYKSLYLGGGVGSGEDNLYKFKKAFNRKDDMKKFYVGQKIYLQDSYDELLTFRENTESSFFPKYRA